MTAALAVALIIAAETSGPELPPWVGVGATILCAVIAALGVVIVRLLRGPVEVKDLWAENRLLRTDLARVEGKVDALLRDREKQITVNRTMVDGFDALSNYVEREAEAAGRPPRFTRAEHEAIETAKALRQDESDIFATSPAS